MGFFMIVTIAGIIRFLHAGVFRCIWDCGCHVGLCLYLRESFFFFSRIALQFLAVVMGYIIIVLNSE